MVKTALLLLAISTAVNFLVGFAGALMAAMVATGDGALPNWAALIIAFCTGTLNSLQSLQPILKQMLVDYGIKVNGAETSAVVKAAAKT